LCLVSRQCNFKSFSEIQRIGQEYSLDSLDKNISLKATRRKIHPIIYILITNHYATLYEIKELMDIDEVLDLYEMCMCNQYNKQIVMEELKP